MAKARRRRIWSGSRDCLANVRRAAASKSGRRGTGAAMALLEQTWPPRNHTQAPRTTPAHESHFRGVGIRPAPTQHREHPGNHEDEVGLALNVEEQAERLDRSACLWGREGLHSGRTPEPHGRGIDHPPAIGADLDGAPGLVAQIKIKPAFVLRDADV